jgi:hypothetical protein
VTHTNRAVGLALLIQALATDRPTGITTQMRVNVAEVSRSQVGEMADGQCSQQVASAG